MARAGGRSGGAGRAAFLPARAAAALAALLAAGAAAAGPQGGKIVAGDARIETRGARTIISQGSDKVVIDWRSFDIEPGEAVRFLQPGKGSIALNRVLADLPTEIRGQLLANGSVWIVNRHGVVFHAGAVVDVGGLIATTADIANADFLAGDYRFDRPGEPGARIVNEGSITFAEAGLAALVAPGVENRGVIAGRLGKVVIAGAETFAVDLAGDGFFAFPLKDGSTRVATSGRIHNPGGHILIAAAEAQGLFESHISVGGVVEARTAAMKGGKIVLSGDGAVEISGAIDATGDGDGERGGVVEATGETVRLTEAARIDVSGRAGGGAARIGGERGGGGDLAPAARLLGEEGAEIRADATGATGDGGEIVLWSEEATAFGGRVSARGGGRGGDGGFAEISSKGLLRFDGAADLSAPFGETGLLLLDPENIVIAAIGAQDLQLDDSEILFGDLDGAATNFTLSAASIAAAAADVRLQATSDIVVNESVAAPFGLSMEAGRNIVLNAGVSAAAALALAADFDFAPFGGPAADGTGTIRFVSGGLSGADVALSAGQALSLGEVMAAGDLSVATARSAINSLDGAAISVGGALSVSGASVNLAAIGPLELGPISATGPFSVSATGAITQSAPLSVSGAATFSARDGATRFGVLLDEPANSFGGRVNAFGDAVGITDTDGLALGAIDAATLSVSAGGAITQAANLAVAGASAFSARSGATRFGLTLGAAANQFGGRVDAFGGAVSLTDADGLIFGAIDAASLTVSAAGAISQAAPLAVSGVAAFSAGAGATRFGLTLDDAANRLGGRVNAFGDAVALGNAVALSLGAIDAATLSVSAGGAITQQAPLAVSGASAFSARSGATRFGLTLANAANRFGGRVDAFGGAVSLSGADGLTLGAIDAATLSVSTTGALTQIAPLAVSGASAFSARSGPTRFALTLGDPANRFGGRVDALGGAVSLADADGLTLGAVDAATLTVSAGGAIGDAAGARIVSTGAASFAAGAGFDLLLDNDAGGGRHLFGGPVSASGRNVTLIASGAIELGEVSANAAGAGGALLVAARGGDISDEAGGAVGFDLSGRFEASGDITLDGAANRYGGPLSAEGGRVTIDAPDALTLGPVDAGTLIVSAGGAIGQTGAISSGAASLAAEAGASRFDLTLTNAANEFTGRVDLTGAAVALVDASALRLGAVDAASLAAASGGAITDTAGARIVVSGAAAFAADGGGRFNVLLDNDLAADRHALDGPVSAIGRNVTLISGGGLALGAIDAGSGGALFAAARGGALTDGAVGAISAAARSAFEATGDLLLDNGHAFGAAGATFLAGGDAALSSTGALRVFDSAAGGAIRLSSGGALRLEEISGGALLGTAAGAIEARDLSLAGLTLGGAGSAAGAPVAAAGPVDLARAIVGAGGLAASSASRVALEDATTSGAIRVRAPEQSYVYVRSDALASGAIADFNAGVAGNAANIDRITLDRMSFGGDIAIAAREIRFGFLRTLGDLALTARAGDVAKLADGAIDYAGARTSGTTVALGRSAETRTATDAAGAFGDLVAVAGDARLDATGAAILARGFEPSGAARHVRIGGALDLAAAEAAVEVAGGLRLGEVAVTGDAAFRFNSDEGPGAGEALTQTAGGSVRIGGRLSIIAGLHGGAIDGGELGDVALANAGNAIGEARLIARNAALRDADGFTVSGASLSGGLTIGRDAAPQAGDVRLSDLALGGALALDAAGRATLSRVASSAIDVAAGGGLAAADLRAAGALRLAAGGSAELRRFSSGAANVSAGGALTIAAGDVGGAGLAAVSGGPATLSDLGLSAGSLSAGGAAALDATRSGGDLSISAASATLGTVSVGGALAVVAATGDIRLASTREAAPSPVAIAGPAGFGLGLPPGAPGAGGAVDAAPGSAGALLARAPFARRVEVAGRATLRAARAVSLPREPVAAGGLHNRFGGPVGIEAGGAATIATSDALSLAASRIGGAFSILTNSDNAGAANGLGQTGALEIGGPLSISAGDHAGAPIASAAILGDVTLTNGANRFAGPVSLVADDAALVAADGLALAPSRLGGSLSATTLSDASSARLSVADLVAGGAATLNAGGAVEIAGLSAGGALSVASRSAGIDAEGVSAGATAMGAAGALRLAEAALGRTTLAAGGAAAVSDLSAGALRIEAASLGLDRATAGTTEVRTAGATRASRLRAGATRIAAEGIVLADAAAAGDLTLLAGAGSAALSDVSATGDARIEAASIGGPGGAARRVAAGGDLVAEAAGALRFGDLVVGGAATMTAGDAARLERFDIGRIRIASGGRAEIANGRTGRLDLTAAASAALTGIRLGALAARAGDGLRLDRAIVARDATIRSERSDVAIGAAEIGGALVAEAAGDIFTIDSGAALAPVSIAAPPGGTALLLGREATSGLLTVAGDTRFAAGGDLAAVNDATGEALENDFQGGVNAVAGGSLAIDDANDLTLGAAGGGARAGVFAGGAIRLEAGGAIRDADRPLARIEAGGDALLLAGGDILLDNGVHAVAGAVGAAGRDVTWTEAGAIRLGPVRARGDLRVVAGAAGTTGDASIRQVGAVNVADPAARGETDPRANAPGVAAPATRRGAIVVAGDADFSTGLDPALGLGAVDSGAARDLALADPGNRIDGTLSLRRIAGDATFVEESDARSFGRGPGTQNVANWEVGGSTALTTTDAIVFLGRLTALDDDDAAPDRVARPGAFAPRLQGEAGLDRARLRLGLVTGEEFRIDTTGGGFAPRGADVRFDRPVDGLNDAPTAGSANIGTERRGLGSLTIRAGREGEARFRDFVGATNPIGPLAVDGGAFFAGFTLAEGRPPAGLSGGLPATRFLFDPDAPDDFLFAGRVRIEVSGDLLAATPPGQVAIFVRQNEYFGVNTPAFVFGKNVRPTSAEAFGFIKNSRQRIAGLNPDTPLRGPDFQFNDCVIGDVGDCANIPIPNVIDQVQIVVPPVLDIDEQELLELFGSFGNEELWGVPQSFLSEFVNIDEPCGNGRTC